MSWKSEKLYFEQDLYFGDLLINLEQAKFSVELESYIFVPDDPVGVLVIEKLKAIAGRGVQVRVLVDAIGSIFWTEELKQAFANSNVQLKFFRSLWWGWWRIDLIFRRRSFLNQRLHRKICLIDNQVLFMGSFNITHKDSRETGVRIESDHFHELRQSFDKLWLRRWRFVRNRFTKVSTTLRFNESRKVRRLFNRDLIAKIANAKRRVWITNAYFVPPLFLIRAFLEAAGRGVDLRIVLPETSDVPLVKSLSSSFYRALLQGGVRIFEYRSKFLHAKSLLIDDWALVGSSNLNYRSLLHDLEIDVVLANPESIKALDVQCNVDQQKSKEITVDDLKNLGWFDRLVGWFLSGFKNWL